LTAREFGAPFPGSPSPSSAPLPVTLTNTGGKALTVSGISIGGGNPGDFTQTSDCLTAALPIGASCTIQVTFTPTVNGLRSANLAVASDDPHSPSTVALSGGASDAPTGTHSIIIFPQRDFISAAGYTDTDSSGNLLRVVVTVFRGGMELRSSEPITPAADPKAAPGDPFAGIVEVNHPGGGCWAVQTPDILPGDVVRT